MIFQGFLLLLSVLPITRRLGRGNQKGATLDYGHIVCVVFEFFLHVEMTEFNLTRVLGFMAFFNA